MADGPRIVQWAEPRLGHRKLELDGAWGLLELSGFGRHYVQLYSLLYALEFGLYDEEQLDDNRAYRAFHAFPWRGGWSAVDFYDAMRYSVPPRHRPQIKEIQYASPGFIDLALIATTAGTLAYIVKKICDSIDRCNATYNTIQNDRTLRKLNKVNLKSAELKLEKDVKEWAAASTTRLASEIGFENVEQLQALSPNPVVALKILLSMYRRFRDLAKLQKRGNIKF